jgi:ketosteroid isomerase-like protein
MTGSTDDGTERFENLFASIDSMDTERFLGFLSKNATFRFGSAEPVTGRDAIAAAVNAFFASVAALRHDLSGVIGDGDTAACEGIVTYTRHDGSTVSLPFVNIFEFQQDLISAYRVYIDIGPLFAE